MAGGCSRFDEMMPLGFVVRMLLHQPTYKTNLESMSLRANPEVGKILLRKRTIPTSGELE
jgi:hypothetical protein